MTANLPLTLVDVFAEGPYTGNQLAVFVGNPPADRMQTLALEMNYSETTFITQTAPVDGGYNVRIFTPVSELPFAGHPTLGTAYVIRRNLIEQPVDKVVLNLKAGQIPVTFADDGFLWMRQNPPSFGHTYAPEEVAEVLGLSLEDMDTHFPVQEVSTGLPFIITPLRTLDAVKRANVNLERFLKMIEAGKAGLGADAMMVFSRETYNARNDLNARVFVHLHGAPEDPATGSANGCLAGYLVKNKYFGSGIVKSRVEQGYEIKRPSLLLLDATDRGDHIEINVGGRVRMVAQGQLVDDE